MYEKSSIDIEETNGHLVMTVWSTKKVLITVAIDEKEQERIQHRTINLDKPLSGKEKQELVRATIAEVLL